MADLLRAALRLRPDRLVVGEIRGDEATELVQALNTGHDGSLATVHANGPADALARIESLVVRSNPGWPLAAVREQVQRSVDIVVHVDRSATGRRSIAHIAEVAQGNPAQRTIPLVVGDTILGSLSRGRR
jgi:pilus assembly protein CpaF